MRLFDPSVPQFYSATMADIEEAAINKLASDTGLSPAQVVSAIQNVGGGTPVFTKTTAQPVTPYGVPTATVSGAGNSVSSQPAASNSSMCHSRLSVTRGAAGGSLGIATLTLTFPFNLPAGAFHGIMLVQGSHTIPLTLSSLAASLSGNSPALTLLLPFLTLAANEVLSVDIFGDYTAAP